MTLTLPGLGSDSSLLGAAEIALEPLFVDPVAALGTALVGVGTRLAMSGAADAVTAPVSR